MRYQVTWRNWRNCGKCNSICICPVHFNLFYISILSPPFKTGHVTVSNSLWREMKNKRGKKTRYRSSIPLQLSIWPMTNSSLHIYIGTYIYTYMYVCLHASPHQKCIHISVFVFTPHLEDFSDMHHDVSTTILVYCCNKQVSNVLLLVQFHTHVSQLVFLNSLVVCWLGLTFLWHLLVNWFRVVWIDWLYVCRVCFDCVSHQWCIVGIYCGSVSSEWTCF